MSGIGIGISRGGLVVSGMNYRERDCRIVLRWGVGMSPLNLSMESLVPPPKITNTNTNRYEANAAFAILD